MGLVLQELELHDEMTICVAVICCHAGGLKDQNPERTKAALKANLGASKAKWKLVTGHHPIASFGQHCNYAMQQDCKDMEFMKYILQVCYACIMLATLCTGV